MDKLYDRQKRSGFFSDFGSIMDFPFYEYNENIDPLFTENSNLKSPLNISVNLQSSMDIHNMENSSDDYFPWSNELKLAINNNNKNYGHLNPDKSAKYEPQNVENGSPQNDNSQTVPRMNQADVSVPNSSSDISNSEEVNRYTRKRRIVADEANASNKLQINNHYERTVTSSRDPLALDSDGGKENDMAVQNSNKREQNGQGTGGRLQSWHMDDITDNLAADLDGSLSGLGADLSSGSYNMNEALLSLPTLQVFKQEALSPPTSHDVSSANISNIQQNPVSTTACQHAALNQQICPSTTREADSNNNQNGTFQNYLGNEYNSSSSSLPTIISSVSLSPQNHDNYARNTVSSTDNSEDCRFQYVLAAATSIATKVNEDTLTYLNQGQSYEIKLKKLGDLSNYKGKILKSVIGICFHERRMQYGERERLSQWQSGRPGDRVLEVDVPLSYGMSRLQQPTLNTVTFTWDPTVPVGVYIKVNCISTEFTPKKHGGEKGVPFRIQVETYLYEPSQNNGGLGMGRRLHTAACQIKVFKLKGADRKHKQDREKIMKRPLCEQEKYQPSYDCTVLNDLPGDAIYPSLSGFMSTMPPAPITVPSNQCNGYMNSGLAPSTSFVKGEDASISPTVPEAKVSVVDINNQMYHGVGLSADATAEQTVAWLTGNRFSAYATTFASFSGSDILRLSRDDLVQICGLADGIRLHNALHAKTIAPKLTLYICTEQTTAFNAVYLRACTSSELLSKLALLAGTGSIPSNCFVVGPNGIKVHVTDDVVRNLRDESMYELLCDSNMLLLKPVIGEN